MVIPERAGSQPSAEWLRRYWPLLLLAAAAFAHTFLYYLYLRDDPGNYNGRGAFGDAAVYVELAEELLAGYWRGEAHYMPGLPAVLALCQLLFGDPRLGLAVVQGLLHALLVLGAACLASATLGSTARWWSAALVALNPVIAHAGGQALTEFLTSALLFATTLLAVLWARTFRAALGVAIGLGVAAMGYLRAEYFGFAVVFALVLLLVGRGRVGSRHAALHGALVLVVVLAAVAPWVVRNAVVTGRAGLYRESSLAHILLDGTWFRVFDVPTYVQLDRVARSGAPYEEAVALASQIGPRPDLSARWMAQERGPRDRPLAEAISLATENARLNLRQYLVNHFALAPVLIWAGHTPVRQADMEGLPTVLRLAFWCLQGSLVALALLRAILLLRAPRAQSRALGLAFLGSAAALTTVHVLIAVDSRFTVPAFPLVCLLAGGALAELVQWLRLRAVTRVPRPAPTAG